MQKELMMSKEDRSPEAIQYRVLVTLLRFGAVPSWCLFWHAVGARDYSSVSERKAWESTIRSYEDRKLIVRTQAAEDLQFESGLPSRTMLIRLAKAGAGWIAQHGVVDVLGHSPAGMRASDFHAPGSWRHDAFASGMQAWFAEQGFEVVSDLELQRACKSFGVKVPDGLVRKLGADGPWTMIEYEFARKTGGWAQRQARTMAQAIESGFVLADRWQVQGALLVTTTRSDSPTAEKFAERIAEFLSEPAQLDCLVVDVDACGKPMSIGKKIVEIGEPEAAVTIDYLPYGKGYLEKLAQMLGKRPVSTDWR